MPKFVYVFTTGGTIGTYVDKSGIARVGNTTENLLSQVDARGIELEAKSLMKKGSANLEPSDWKIIAKAVGSLIKKRGEELSGIVILHGTDTMHYTAAALSLMAQNPGLPIVITGSMITGSDPDGDAISNLNAALLVAAKSSIAEVSIVFSADPSGKKKMVIRGCRARKIRSIALNAFDSINIPPLAFVENGKINYTGVKHRVRGSRQKLIINTSLEQRVAYIKQNPGLTNEVLRQYLECAEGAVMEGTGRGHVNEKLLDTISAFGKPVVASTQAIYGGEALGTYDIGKMMLGVQNIIPAGDMTSEAALVKLMWALGQNGSVRGLMRKNICGEISHEINVLPLH